jgi:long-chain acyl-CoA synthetase
VNENQENLARGLMLKDLCPEVGEGDDKFRFCGIWCKNRWEWLTTLLACMNYKMTVVGFYDAMGTVSVEFILNQTEMTTIIASSDYVQKILEMKKDGMAEHIKTLVTLDPVSNDVMTLAEQQQVTVLTY